MKDERGCIILYDFRTIQKCRKWRRKVSICAFNICAYICGKRSSLKIIPFKFEEKHTLKNKKVLKFVVPQQKK